MSGVIIGWTVGVTVGVVVWGVIWGFVTRGVVVSRGYNSGTAWFFIGFFLGFIGLIIAVLTKPDLRQMNGQVPQNIPQAGSSERGQAMAKMNGQVPQNIPQAGLSEREQAVAELKKCKELLDSGVLTEEEFQAQKQKLLVKL